MSTKLTVALIGASATVLVSLIVILVKRGKERQESLETQIRSLPPGGYLVIPPSGKPVTGESRLMSEDGAKLILAVSKEVIADEVLRRRWTAFNAEFVMTCLKGSPFGMAFDGEVFEQYCRRENDEMFTLGVRVYEACCKHAGKNNPDYRALNRIGKVYESAKALLR